MRWIRVATVLALLALAAGPVSAAEHKQDTESPAPGGRGPGMMGPGTMGPGMMGPGMMGPGTMGPGMMGPGMMGPGMMGPGMMGPGMMGPGTMGPGMMGPGMMDGCPMAGGHTGAQMGLGLPAAPAPLGLDQARSLLEQRLALVGNPRLKLGSVVEKDSRTIGAEIVTQDGSLVQKLELDRLTGQMWQAP